MHRAGPTRWTTRALFALLGGAWGPIAGSSDLLNQLAQLLPSYWLTQAAHSAFTGHSAQIERAVSTPTPSLGKKAAGG